MRRTTGWLLTFAMFILVVDISLERSRRGRQPQASAESTQVATKDGGNGLPPSPKP